MPCLGPEEGPLILPTVAKEQTVLSIAMTMSQTEELEEMEQMEVAQQL